MDWLFFQKHHSFLLERFYASHYRNHSVRMGYLSLFTLRKNDRLQTCKRSLSMVKTVYSVEERKNEACNAPEQLLHARRSRSAAEL